MAELLHGGILKHYMFLSLSAPGGGEQEGRARQDGLAHTATGSAVTLETVPCHSDVFVAMRWVFPAEAIASARSGEYTHMSCALTLHTLRCWLIAADLYVQRRHAPSFSGRIRLATVTGAHTRCSPSCCHTLIARAASWIFTTAS